MNIISRWLDSHITLHTHDSPKEELANSLTHGIGALLSVAGLILMLQQAASIGASAAEHTALVVFGISMILSYTSSAVYHMIRPSSWKRFLRILDHVNIYILIAGTYTPFCMVLPEARKTSLLILVWSIVVLGTVFKLVFWGRMKVLHTLIYLAMGWLVVFFVKDFIAAFPLESLYWMLAGGLAYTVGTIFYGMKKMPFYHAVWHLFVLAGSAFFFGGIYTTVIPLYL